MLSVCPRSAALSGFTKRVHLQLSCPRHQFTRHSLQTLDSAAVMGSSKSVALSTEWRRVAAAKLAIFALPESKAMEKRTHGQNDFAALAIRADSFSDSHNRWGVN